jgi:hypothetical protein
MTGLGHAKNEILVDKAGGSQLAVKGMYQGLTKG